MVRRTQQALPGDFSGLVLDDNQRRVVEWDGGFLVVSAGPGSGKTRVTTERIIRLIKEGVPPHAILATTFTKKAAGEMNSRLKANGIDSDSMAVQTMHSLCYSILFKLASSGLQKKSLDNAEWKYDNIIKAVIGHQHMRWGADPTRVKQFISLAKAALLTPEEAREQGPLFDRREFSRDTRFPEAYSYAEEMRISAGILTHDDMLVEAVRLLRRDERTSNLLHDRFQYVIVDEFQDTNRVQLALIEEITKSPHNVMLVGDVDQAIYAFRGAEPRFMVELARDARATTITIGTNYRSPAVIVDHATRCIENNSNRVTKTLTAAKHDEGSAECWVYSDSHHEAWDVVDRIEEVHRSGVPYREVFILYRTHAQSAAIEEELTRRQIPYWIKRGGAFYKRKEVRGLLAYLRLLVNPQDAKAGRQALTNPFRKIGRQDLDAIEHEMRRTGLGYVDAAERIGHVRWNAQISSFVALMRALDAEVNAGALLDAIEAETSYIDEMTASEGSGDHDDSIEVAVNELIGSARRFCGAASFLAFVEEQIERTGKRRRKRDEVQCLTIHGAKGLEATLVCLVGVNKGLLPISKAKTHEAFEEERRLFYVAMTRSKKYLHVSCNGEPSSFIEEAGFVIEDRSDEDDE